MINAVLNVISVRQRYQLLVARESSVVSVTATRKHLQNVLTGVKAGGKRGEGCSFTKRIFMAFLLEHVKRKLSKLGDEVGAGSPT